ESVALRPLRDELADFFYAPRWVHRPIEPASARDVPASPAPLAGRVLVIGSAHSAGLEHDVERLYPEGTIVSLAIEGCAARRGDTGEAFPTVVEGLRSVAAEAPVDTIYHFGGIDLRPSDAVDFSEAQERGVLALFRLVKVLVE